MALKTIKDFNADRRKVYGNAAGGPVKNGIACPECGEELWDIEPREILTSYPPQKSVACLKCGYTGYRVA